MNEDNLHRNLINVGRKPFRRVRKHRGEKWIPKKDAVLTTVGLYCVSCRSRHSYSNKKLLGCMFERHSGTWYLLWYCKRAGTVLKEQPLL